MATYDIVTNTLTVEDKKGTKFILDTEPDHYWFLSSIYAHWKLVDEQFGDMYMEDRSDYEPWSYDSIKALAIELNQHEEENVIKFYGKDFKC